MTKSSSSVSHVGKDWLLLIAEQPSDTSLLSRKLRYGVIGGEKDWGILTLLRENREQKLGVPSHLEWIKELRQ